MATLKNVYKITPAKRQITVDENITCSLNYDNKTVKEEFESFKTRVPDENSDFPTPFYSFTFENGKCVLIYAEHGQ